MLPVVAQAPERRFGTKEKVQDRFEVFADGDWASLLASSMEHASRAAQASSRRSRRQDTDNVESRAARAEALVHMGELSAARQALEGAAVAPGTRDTLNALQDPERRHPVLRDPIHILHAVMVDFGQTDFGQIEFDLLCVVCCVCVVSVCVWLLCVVWRGCLFHGFMVSRVGVPPFPG